MNNIEKLLIKSTKNIEVQNGNKLILVNQNKENIENLRKFAHSLNLKPIIVNCSGLLINDIQEMREVIGKNQNELRDYLFILLEIENKPKNFELNSELFQVHLYSKNMSH